MIFFKTHKGQITLNFLFSFFAAVVIFAAMMKILHWKGAHPQVFQHRKKRKYPSSLRNMRNAFLRDLMGGQLIDPLAIQRNHSRFRMNDAGDRLQGGALAGPIRSDDRYDLTVLNREGYVPKGRCDSVTHSDVLNVEH